MSNTPGTRVNITAGESAGRVKAGDVAPATP